jgi:hypothetical protein
MMFEGFRAKRAARSATARGRSATTQFDKKLASWQEERDSAQSLLEAAQTEGTSPDGLALHRGELCYGTLTCCSLVEERRGRGHFETGSAGVSIPIGKVAGRPIRYRLGATRGHYVEGTPSPTAIATGTLYVTNQRLVFLSNTQTRECRYDHLVGIQRADELGSLTVSLSNRQHPVVFSFGKDASPWLALHIEIAMSYFRGDHDELVKQLAEKVAELDTAKPESSTVPSPQT